MKREMICLLASTAVVAVLCAVIVFVGQSDMRDAENEQAVYCSMVKEGSWPDYKGIYGEVCK